MSRMPTLHLSGELMLGRKILPVRIPHCNRPRRTGAACAMAALDYHGLLCGRGLVQIHLALCRPFRGDGDAHPERLAEFLHDEGLSVEIGEEGRLGLLCDAIDNGTPALVLDAASGGGWRIVAGYESVDCGCGTSVENLLLAGRGDACAVVAPQVFLEQWHEHRLFERPFKRLYILPVGPRRAPQLRSTSAL